MSGLPARPAIVCDPPIKVAVLCLCDDAAVSPPDAQAMVDRLCDGRFIVVSAVTVADETDGMQAQVQAWIDSGTVDVILTIDRMTLSSGSPPPSIMLFLNDDPQPIYSLSAFDDALGWIGWVDLRTAFLGQSAGVAPKIQTQSANRARATG